MRLWLEVLDEHVMLKNTLCVWNSEQKLGIRDVTAVKYVYPVSMFKNG